MLAIIHFAVQSEPMETNWAAENLQTIRTLMERSALYRRALAPITTFVGIVGIIAAIAGCLFLPTNGNVFVTYWMAISLVAILGALFIVRRQAVRNAEPFWSPPARRVAKAMLPALLVGVLYGCFSVGNPTILVLIWTQLYGLALHSAGSFMPRGVRLFAWGFLIAPIVTFFVLDHFHDKRISDHLLMGLLFGASHLAYGIYLYFTEKRKNET
jgi:hypothetical protein